MPELENMTVGELINMSSDEFRCLVMELETKDDLREWCEILDELEHRCFHMKKDCQHEKAFRIENRRK